MRTSRFREASRRAHATRNRWRSSLPRSATAVCVRSMSRTASASCAINSSAASMHSSGVIITRASPTARGTSTSSGSSLKQCGAKSTSKTDIARVPCGTSHGARLAIAGGDQTAGDVPLPTTAAARPCSRADSVMMMRTYREAGMWKTRDPKTCVEPRHVHTPHCPRVR